MQCPICSSDCQTIEPDGNYTHIDCPDCGEYKIVRRAMEVAASETIDVSVFRDYLSKKRKANQPAPMITSLKEKQGLVSNG